MLYRSMIANRARWIVLVLPILFVWGVSIFSSAGNSTLAAPAVVQAEGLECHPGYGGELFAAGGQVEVDILKSYSDSTNDIFLFRRGQTPLLLGNDGQTGRVIHLGSIPAGEELLFGIKVRETGATYKMGPIARNPDGLFHARVDCITERIANVSFEDEFGGGDNDFNDAVIQVRISRKRGIQESIDNFAPCDYFHLGTLRARWGLYGDKNSLDSNAGERLELQCNIVGGLIHGIPSYELKFTRPGNPARRVGLCPFKGGRNSGLFTYSGDVDRDGTPDSFVLTYWESRDYGENDIPNPWTHEQQETPPVLDHAVSIYDVFINNLIKYDDKYDYRTPPPLPSEGRFLRRIRLADPALGPETEAFFDSIGVAMQDVPSSTFPIEADPYSLADLNRDGNVDQTDRQIFQDLSGTCEGDSAFDAVGDFDGDGCVTSLDEDAFLDLFTGSEGNRRPRAQGKTITVDADASCTARINANDVNDGSFDPDGDSITLALDSTGPFDLGQHLVTLTATDSHGASSAFITTVTVISRPVISGVSVDTPRLWPPNHKMVEITVNYIASDQCVTGAVTCILSVSSNEPLNGTGDGDTTPDWEVVDAHHVRLRAERAGTGNGRIYTINITCTNSGGYSSTKATSVIVPKSQGGK